MIYDDFDGNSHGDHIIRILDKRADAIYSLNYFWRGVGDNYVWQTGAKTAQ